MRGHSYQNLANEDVQSGRAAKVVPPSGRPLHDYVPLYFGHKTPMVAVNKRQNEEIVFLRFSLEILTLPGVIITDGNARSNATKFQAYAQLGDLSFLDVKAIHSVKYAGDSELKRRKQAEILIPDKLPFGQVLDIMCFSKNAQERTLKILEDFSITKPVTLAHTGIFTEGWRFDDYLH